MTVRPRDARRDRKGAVSTMGTIGSITTSAVALPTTTWSLGGSSTAARPRLVPTEAQLAQMEGELGSPQAARLGELVKSMGTALGPTTTLGRSLDGVSSLLVGVSPDRNPLAGTMVGGAIDLTNSTISGALSALNSTGGTFPGDTRLPVERARDVFSSALDPADGSPSVYEANAAMLDELAARYRRELKEKSDPTIVMRLMVTTMLQGINRREQEKIELLKGIMISLWLGQVPTALISRARELGLGHIVEQMVATIMGRGENGSKGAARALRGLGFSVVEDHQTDEGLRERKDAQEQLTFQLQDGAVVDGFGQQLPGQVAGRYLQASGRATPGVS